MGFLPLKDVIRDLVRPFGMDLDEMEAIRCLEEVMPDLKGRARIRCLRDGTLFLEIESPVLASQVRLRKGQIIEEMERRMGKRVVRDILCI